MSSWYPNAVHKPISRNFGGRRSRTRAVILHVDAGGAASLQGWFNNAASGASSHFHVRYDGVVEQYVDADLTAWTQRAGNSSCIGIETQGKGDGAWTAAQLSSLASLVRWLCDRYGIPKRSMGNSLPSSSGIGYHRMGIDPWRVSGGEVWGPRGKVCPGNLRVDQFPGLVASVAAGSVSNPIGGSGSVAKPNLPGAPAPIIPVPEEDDDMRGLFEALYRYYLGREGSPAEVDKWTVTAARAGLSLKEAEVEFAKATAEPGTVSAAYREFLGREASPAEVASWVNQRATVRAVRDAIANSPEAKKRKG